MGRALYRPRSRPPIEDFSKASVRHPKMAATYRAYVDDAGRWWQEESLPGTDFERRVEVRYVIGSGNHARSYLGEVDGELVELPITWYVRKAIWDMSPGYEGAGHMRFLRPVRPECLFCHNDLTRHVPETDAGYAEPLREGITCVRCHGDGAAHVLARRAGTATVPDDTILDPARLPPARAQQICQQCHLQGVARVLREGRTWDAYDVRQPLSDHLSAFVAADDGGRTFGIASHAARLALSACAKDGRLRCTTCHDPHRKKGSRAARDACLGCHRIEACPDPKRAGDCAGCHMPSGGTNDIPHVHFTDHFIRRSPGRTPAAPKVSALVGALGATDANAEVRRGMATVLAALQGDTHRALLPTGIALLAGSLEAHPARADAWDVLGRGRLQAEDYAGAVAAFAEAERRGHETVAFRSDQAGALMGLGRLAEAERVLSDATERAPDHGLTWGLLGSVRHAAGRLAEAEAAFARAAALLPSDSSLLNNRGYNLLAWGRLDEADRWLGESVRLDPLNAAAVVNRGHVAASRGDHLAARKAFEDGLRIAPHHVEAYGALARLEVIVGDVAAARGVLARGRRAVPGYPGWAELEAAVLPAWRPPASPQKVY